MQLHRVAAAVRPGRHPALRGKASAASRVAERLTPTREDDRVLKPKHSACYATPLELLLSHRAVGRLILPGGTADPCVLATAADARMRNFAVAIPPDCVPTLSDERDARAARYFGELLGVEVSPSGALRWPESAPEDGAPWGSRESLPPSGGCGWCIASTNCSRPLPGSSSPATDSSGGSRSSWSFGAAGAVGAGGAPGTGTFGWFMGFPVGSMRPSVRPDRSP